MRLRNFMEHLIYLYEKYGDCKLMFAEHRNNLEYDIDWRDEYTYDTKVDKYVVPFHITQVFSKEEDK